MVEVQVRQEEDVEGVALHVRKSLTDGFAQ
jgi:hypothetical protein